MTSPIKGLMTGLIDYAGLFPPAGLEMREAVRRYAGYRGGGHAQALGRFIIPAGQLEEMKDAVLSLPDLELQDTALPGMALPDTKPALPWPLSVILGNELGDGLAGVARFQAEATARGGSPWAQIDSLEHRVSHPEHIGDGLALIGERLGRPESIEVYFEVPLQSNLEPFVDAIANPFANRRGGPAITNPGGVPAVANFGASPGPEVEELAGRAAFAKIRTGGVTSEDFPEPAAILRFLICCRDAGVSFKATAGLHHPLRGIYPMTYEEDAAVGTMTGFLNLFLTAAAVHARMGEEAEWLALLTEDTADAFTFSSSSIRWRDLVLPVADIVAARHNFARSYGSCSFEEPIEGLRALAVSCQEA